MAQASGQFSDRGQYWLVITVDQASQNVAGNYSTVNIYVDVNEVSENGSWDFGGASWSASCDWYGTSGSFTYDFRNYNGLRLLGTSINIGHNADGTKYIGFAASVGGGTTIGSAYASGAMWLSTIPRASTSSWAAGTPNPPDIGSTQTLNTNRASTGFTHTLDWAFGTLTGNIGTGVGASVAWTIPTSLLTQIPNASQGNGTITTRTYSGATLIGTTTSGFTVKAASTVVPTWTSVATSEANSDVATKVGAFVQGVSQIGYAITGAAGVSGSTITSQQFTVAGQTVSGASGATPNPITASGNVPATYTITDSRGRQKTQTDTISVLPYTTPVFNSILIQRALVDGTVDDDDGTYLKISVSAAVSSLVNGTQKNAISFAVYSKLRSSNTWTLNRTYVPGGTAFNGNFLVTGPFLVDKAYDVRVEASDIFNTSSSITTIPVAAIFMHWGTGLGIGKFWEQGAVDVGPGGIYDNGVRVLNANDVTVTDALLDASYRGEGSAKVNTGAPGGALSASAYPWMTNYVPNGNRQVKVMKTNGSYAIVGQTMGERVNLTLAPNWYVYDELTVSTGFSPKVQAHKLPTGLVVLKGLIRHTGTPGAGTVITTLPAGMRPDATIYLPALFNDQVGSVRIQADGQVALHIAAPTYTYVSLDGLTFFAAGSVTWTNVGDGGSAWGPNFKEPNDTSVVGRTKWYKDPYGFVWFQGLVEVKTATSTDNTPIITLPPSCASYLEQHFRGATTQYTGFGYKDTSGVPQLSWKTNDAGAVGNSMSIAGVSAITMDAFNNNPWYTPVNLANSWVPNSASHPVPRFLRREDGLCMTMGLVRAGTVGTRIIQTHSELWPRLGRVILATISNNGNARVDIGSDSETDNNMRAGWIFLQQGSNTWFGLDGLKWVP